MDVNPRSGCAINLTLEVIGDKWSLLVIRDLLTGAKRFTDLMDRLGGITPKTLSQRLRELEDAGLVSRSVDPGDARAVRIRITAQGRRTLNAVRADRAAAIEPQLAMLEPGDRQVLVDAVQVLRRLLDNAAVTPRRNTL